ncbi:MAG TPA: carboxypeptidase regulatory-like domain-containing protein [Pyrinomonadaceae bacterium]
MKNSPRWLLLLSLAAIMSMLAFGFIPGVSASRRVPQEKRETTAPNSAPQKADDASDQQKTKAPRGKRPDIFANPDPALENDPDLPNIAKGIINRYEYLRRREEYTSFKRGDLPGQPFSPLWRGEAIQKMKQQESYLRSAAARLKGQPGGAGDSVLPYIATNVWTELGPSPLPNGQTQDVEVPVSGRVTCIALHPTNTDIAYVGTAQGGLYRTLNGGYTWTQLFNTAESLAIGSVAIAPSDTNIVYVGTGETSVGGANQFAGIGMYRINNAETTADLTGPINPLVTTGVAGTRAFTSRSISKIVVHPTDPATIFASTSQGTSGNPNQNPPGVVPTFVSLRGVYRSTDATASSPTFTKLTVTTAGSVGADTTGNRNVTDMVLEPGTPNNLLVAVASGLIGAGESGIYRSTNALAAAPTFTRTLAYDNAGNGTARGELAIVKIGSTVTVAATSDENQIRCNSNTALGTGQLRISTDGGVSWSLPKKAASGFCGGQCFYNMAVAFDPTDANIIYLGGQTRSGCNTNMSKSVDGGTTFTYADTGLHADSHAVVVSPSNPKIVWTGNDGGIFRSADRAAAWMSFNNTGFSATQFQSLALHPKDRYFTLGGTQDNGTELQVPDQDVQKPFIWTNVDFGDGGQSAIDQTATDTENVTMYHTYFNLTNGQGIAKVNARSEARKGNWQLYGCGFGGAIPNGFDCITTTNILFYAPIALGPGVTENTLYYGSDYLYRSQNPKTTMTMEKVSQKLTDAISNIAISPQDDNVRLVGLRNRQVFYTTAGLPALLEATPPVSTANGNKPVGDVAIDPNSKFTAYVTYSGYGLPAGQHVYKTTNLDAAIVTWTASGTGIPDVPVNAIAIDPQNSNNVYVGTDIGVYVSTDAGATWNPYGTGLPRVAVFDMAIQNVHRILRIATHGRGMWEIGLAPANTLSISGTVRDGSSTPVSGAKVRLNNAAATEITTGPAGTYSFTNLPVGGNYTVSVTKAATRFSPPYRTFNDMSASQTADFTGTASAGGSTPDAGGVLITEFRSSGPAGATDEFVELYNNSDSAITVQASDATAGWSVYALDATGTTPVEIAVIPNGTLIPARGHLLLTGAAYTLEAMAGGDLNYSADMPDNTGVALFRTTSVTPFNGANRLDGIAFGSTGGALTNSYGEGTLLSGANTTGIEYSYVRKVVAANGFLLDTNDNANDILFVSTNATVGSTLGAPGPENVFSPIARTLVVRPSFIDPTQCSTCEPNYERNGQDAGADKAFGTLTLRRRFTNNTGQTVTRLRFRVIDITTLNTPGVSTGRADLRLLDSTDVIRTVGGNPIVIKGTLVDQPPAQPLGGGQNSVATVVLPDTGLASTVADVCPPTSQCSVDVQFVLGVQQNGLFRFFVAIESLP